MTETKTDTRQFPSAMVNITNRCTLRCEHCFVFRDSNPNDPKCEMDTPTMLEKLKERKERHGLRSMLWMGGEPLLRPDVLAAGVMLFESNTITTNGTLDLIDFPNTGYVVSIDGPPEVNDRIRGKGSFKKVINTLSRLPEAFANRVMCQCVVTKKNEDQLEALIGYLRPLPVEGLTFSFYVPRKDDKSDLTWGSLKRRDEAVREVMRIKKEHPDFIRNHGRSLDLLMSEKAKTVTDNCPSKKLVLPLYLEGQDFVSPFCCYGNDVDCDLCGAWVVFHLAANMERTQTNQV